MIHLILAAVAFTALLLSLVVHVAAWFHREFPIGDGVFILHVGCLGLGFVMVHFANQTKPEGSGRGNLDHLFRLLPEWGNAATILLFIYALAQFGLFMWQSSDYPKHGVPHDLVVRGFSGHWLLFYGWEAAAFTGLYLRQRRLDSSGTP